MKFCRACGGEVNSRNYCSSCGKQYFSFRNKWVVATVTLALLFLGSAVCNYLSYARIQSQASSIASLSSSSDALQLDLQTKTQEYFDLQSDYIDSLADIEDLRSRLSKSSDTVASLQDEKAELLAELDARLSSYSLLSRRSSTFSKYVVFYNPGCKYYHACVDSLCGAGSDGYANWLYDGANYKNGTSVLCSPEEALSRGYLPCPGCMG